MLSILALLFIAILGEGLLVAGSGFLSDENDKLIQARDTASKESLLQESRWQTLMLMPLVRQDVVLPAFTPTVGIFLTSSSGYGFWKTRDNSSEPTK